jgi:hypothetical protein
VVSFAAASGGTLNFTFPGNTTYGAAAQKQQTFNVAAVTSGSNSGSSMTNPPDSPALYYVIGAASNGSSTSTANGLAIGTAATLTGLTLTMSSPRPTTRSATIGIILGGVWTATVLTCSVTEGSGQTVCTSNLTVSVSAAVRFIFAASETYSTQYRRP